MLKHGHRKSAKETSPTWISWRAMNARCYNRGARDYRNYGGRGIRVCRQWRRSFENFLAAMGERPAGKTLERKNNSGDYAPKNCRWATSQEQGKNKRSSVLLTLHGCTATLGEWSKAFGINRHTIMFRIRKGWSARRAIVTPPMSRAQRGILGLKARGLL